VGHVIVQVNGRPYTMQCQEGEEEHLLELAALLDSEVAQVKQSVGNVGDIRLLVMSGLMVADRLSEAIRRIEALEEQISGLRSEKTAAEFETRSLANRFTLRLDAASARLEALAQDVDAKLPRG
jgi:cell division protein ZapA